MEIPVILPALVWGSQNRLVTAGPSIVDQDVGAAELALDRGDEVANSAGFADVGLHTDGFHAELVADLPGNLDHPFLITGAECQMDTLGRKASGDSYPNACTPPGDGSHFVLQAKIHIVSPFPSVLVDHRNDDES